MWDNRSRLSRHRLESLCHQAFPDLWVGQIPRRNCLGKSPLNPPRVDLFTPRFRSIFRTVSKKY
ncbi:MAG: hypothetical protein A2Y80_00285 [Deltaproteobacteria bacterium RBG_13_58_19]|nr:MAG: hypothetical protein A2Y80_00285 [Deltaproteobacteria bacterium RBG_13_58_19]